MQNALFPDDHEGEQRPPLAAAKTALKVKAGSAGVVPLPPIPRIGNWHALCPRVHWAHRRGTTPDGLAWEGDYAESQLSKHGLTAYEQTRLG